MSSNCSRMRRIFGKCRRESCALPGKPQRLQKIHRVALGGWAQGGKRAGGDTDYLCARAWPRGCGEAKGTCDGVSYGCGAPRPLRPANGRGASSCYACACGASPLQSGGLRPRCSMYHTTRLKAVFYTVLHSVSTAYRTCIQDIVAVLQTTSARAEADILVQRSRDRCASAYMNVIARASLVINFRWVGKRSTPKKMGVQ